MRSVIDVSSPYGTYGLPYVGRIARRCLPAARAMKLGRIARFIGQLYRLEVADVDFHGSEFRLYQHRNRTDWIILNFPNTFDHEELGHLASLLNKDTVFFDIGANSGAYTAFALQYGAKTVSAEACPSVFERLRFNIRNPRALLLNVAVVAQGDRAVLYRDGRNEGQNSTIVESSESIEVDAISLSGLIKRHARGCPTVVKLDVEGAESSILRACFDESAQGTWPRAICFEHAHSSEPEKIVREAGYSIALRTDLNAIARR